MTRLTRRRLLTGVGAGLVAALALSGCSSQGAASEPKSVAAGALPGEHVHGISRDPGSGKVNLATHEGLFVLQPDASWLQVGPTVDFMGFAISGPGVFYASGHPAEGVDLPAPVGLMKSTDAGLGTAIGPDRLGRLEDRRRPDHRRRTRRQRRRRAFLEDESRAADERSSDLGGPRQGRCLGGSGGD